jgi:hypothetical protein
MKISFVLLYLLIIVSSCQQVSPDTATDILHKSIRFHDPDNKWPHYKGSLQFQEERPDGATRNTHIWIDNTAGFFKINRNDQEIHGMDMDSCYIEKGDVTCERAATMRNYYLYLWGLPMKLMDENTNLKPDVRKVKWENKSVYQISVDYKIDSWSFYIEEQTYQLVGYAFEKKDGSSGERIVLDEIQEVDGMKIPSRRSWFTLENEFLGTDILVEAGPF